MVLPRQWLVHRVTWGSQGTNGKSGIGSTQKTTGNHHWMVVLTILRNISQWEGLSHILWKIKNVWNHQPAIVLHPHSIPCHAKRQSVVASKWLWDETCFASNSSNLGHWDGQAKGSVDGKYVWSVWEHMGGSIVMGVPPSSLDGLLHGKYLENWWWNGVALFQETSIWNKYSWEILCMGNMCEAIASLCLFCSMLRFSQMIR